MKNVIITALFILAFNSSKADIYQFKDTDGRIYYSPNKKSDKYKLLINTEIKGKEGQTAKASNHKRSAKKSNDSTGKIISVDNFKGIEIKGLHVGLSKNDVLKKIGNGKFTIAGVESKYNNARIDYYNGKLDTFMFFFSPSGFDAVFEAIKEKYPNIDCEDSEVSNAMGARFQQKSCDLSDDETTLGLRRLVDIDTSVLSLISRRYINHKKDIAEKNKKDI